MLRKANISDIDEIMNIYTIAKETMRNNGNPTQWSDKYPSRELLLGDINKENCYIIYDEDGIYGVFVYIKGIDSSYLKIKGSWLNDEPYGTIHRIASSNTKKGVLKEAIDFATSNKIDIRIDTHRNNTIMQHLLDKYGFIKCGTIYVEDGTARIAYQKEKDLL